MNHVVLYWLKSFCRVRVWLCCTLDAQFSPRGTQPTLDWPIPFFPSVFLFVPCQHPLLFIRLLLKAVSVATVWPLLLSARSSVAVLIDGWGPAIKTIWCCQIRTDKCGPQLLTSQECLRTRDHPAIFCPQIYRHTSADKLNSLNERYAVWNLTVCDSTSWKKPLKINKIDIKTTTYSTYWISHETGLHARGVNIISASENLGGIQKKKKEK